MRALTYFVAVTLDGRIAGRDGDFSAFPVTGDHMDMIVTDYPDTLPGLALAALGRTAPTTRFDTVVMGWNTYAVGLPDGVDDPYPHLRQYVFTQRSGQAAGDVTFTDDDPVAVVQKLKAEPGGAGIWLCGGGRLAASLVDEIDRLVLKVNPLILGEGIPLFDGGGTRAFTLEASRTFDSGVVVNEYRRC
jgi:dihydrofolate reductase